MTTLAASPPPVAFPHVAADHALLQRVMEEEQVARTLPGPDWTGYLVELARAGLDALPDVLEPARDAMAGLGLSMDAVATVLLGLVAVAIAAIATVAARRLLRRARPPALPRREDTREDAPLVRHRDEWRALLDQHLRDGRTAEALEAAWWWLAASISRGAVDPAWTSRELLVRSGRLDLGAGAAALDRMTYGPRRPAPAEVRAVVETLAAAV